MIPRLPLAVTCGDPAGIGTEVLLAAHEEIGQEIQLFGLAIANIYQKGNRSQLGHQTNQEVWDQD
tara:strand:- start:45 stop:239 length:195 start_codon:yes stop_codon:yes gene_type:complete